MFGNLKCDGYIAKGHLLMCALLLFTMFFLPTELRAQSAAECASPDTQQLMNACAAKTYKIADTDLNVAWRSAKSFADAIGRGDALLAAQRIWIKYRDDACEVHASAYEGGSIYPMILSDCLRRVTTQRTEMLLDFNAY